MAGKLKGCWWGKEDMAILERLWPERSASEIGDILKMTRNMVIGKARRMKLPAKAVGVHSGPKRAKSSRGGVQNLGPGSPRKDVRHVLSDAGVAPGPREAIPAEGISLMALESHHCRYIVGQCADGSASYCGQQKTIWRHPRSRLTMPVSYCSEHARRCFNPS